MRFSSLLFTLLSIASSTLASPLAGAANPKPNLVARQAAAATSTQDVSVIAITLPAITPGPTGSGGSGSQTIGITIPTCSMTAVPDKDGYVPPGTCHAYYDYYPSFGLALFFAILFGALTTTHIVQAIIHRKKALCWVIIMAALWEFGSYAARTLSTKNQQSSALVFVSQVLVLLAPLWVNAFDYMLFARMVHYFLPAKSVFGIRAGTFAYIFVALDIVAFIIQLIGGFTAGPNAPPDQELKGIHIYMGGIGLQEFFIVCFLALVVRFQLEIRRLAAIPGALDRAGGVWDARGRRLLYTVYASLAFITIRIIVRLIEHASPPNQDNVLLTHEGYFYAFEALPMFLAIGSLNLTHPGTVLKGPAADLPKTRFWARLCCCACCCAGKRKAQRSRERYEELEEVSLAKMPASSSSFAS